MEATKTEKHQVSGAREYSELTSANIAGDAIGETVYSERFVLKMMLKFTNLDSYKLDLCNIHFEEDLCILWDMTAEKDVCKFMIEHDYFNLIRFVFPHTNNNRILEIIIGIIANMCCLEEIVLKLTSNYNDLCTDIFETVHTYDSLILIQVLRFVHFCFYNSTVNQVKILLNILKNSEFDRSMLFIMRNSSNENVLMATLETMNCICRQSNVDECRREFFNLFVSDKYLSSLIVTFTELCNLIDKESNESNISRFHIVYLEISLNLTGFENFKGISSETTVDFSNTLTSIVDFYKLTFLKTNELSLEFLDIFEYIKTIILALNLHTHTSTQGFLICILKLWLDVIKKINKCDTDSVEYEIQDLEKLNDTLSSIVEHFLLKMSDDTLRIVLNNFKNHELFSIVDVFNKRDSDIDELLQRLNKFSVKLDT